jgi:hypothetical protein
MKRSGVLVLWLVVAAAISLSAASAFAEEYVCEVKEAGPAKTYVRFVLTDTASPAVFEDTAFRALADRESQMLAVALIAKSSGMHVKISTTLSAKGMPTVRAMYLVE